MVYPPGCFEFLKPIVIISLASYSCSLISGPAVEALAMAKVRRRDSSFSVPADPVAALLQLSTEGGEALRIQG